MTDKELLKQLEKLQEMRAPKSVHRFVHTQTAALSEKHRGLYMPLVAFRMGFAVAVLLFFVLATSGVVVAAAKSTPGSFFYPVRQVMQVLPVTKHIMPTPTLILAPTHEIRPTAMPTPTKEQEKKDEHDDQRGNNGRDVKGISTEASVPTQKPEEHARLNQVQNKKTFHFSFDFFQQGKNHK